MPSHLEGGDHGTIQGVAEARQQVQLDRGIGQVLHCRQAAPVENLLRTELVNCEPIFRLVPCKYIIRRGDS